MKERKDRLLKIIITSFVVGIGLVILLSALFYILVLTGAFGSLPGRNELSEISTEEASLVYSSDSVLIGKFFAKDRTNINMEEVPDHLLKALIETEDRRFYTHKGYDTRSYLRVFLRTILIGDESGGGGSTITQQLVKNLYGRTNHGFLSLPVNKMKEIIIASRLEKVYDKKELLLLYLNSVPFGEDIYGVESASRRYFSKTVSRLKIEESAVLVGMLKANTYFNPRQNPERSLGRRNVVLSLMERAEYLEAVQADSLRALPLELKYTNLDRETPAGYFVYQVRKRAKGLLDSLQLVSGREYKLEKDGLRIYTTLDMRVQELASRTVKEHMQVMQDLLDRELEARGIKQQWYSQEESSSYNFVNDTGRKNTQLFSWEKGIELRNISRRDSLWHYHSMLNASVLAINPSDGGVITWIGGNNYRLLPFDMVLSHRQIASAFKPVLYATAIENGVPPCKYLQNEKNTYEGYEDWEPQNYDRITTPDSTVALWYALSHSMNLPTLDLYFQTGRDELLSTCERLGFPPVRDDAPSTALGTLDLSLYEIVRAYGVFANKGNMNEPYMIRMIRDADGNVLYTRKNQEPDSIFSEETGNLMTAILKQVIDQGTGVSIRSPYGIKTDLAGKTGTAQNYSDAWFLAYTPEMVIGTWVGARTPDVHFNSENGTGSSLALPLVAGVIKGIENDTDLREIYLGSFDLPGEVYSFLECDPFRQKGIRGFFNRLFGIKQGEEDAEESTEETGKGVKSFFERLFRPYRSSNGSRFLP
ncbi:MAG: transglycosylase domain-containing protein [Bacteroidales bacterium]|nr:transglycosylase domain-containing protein [Bacteroidales bacterium]